MTDEPPARDHDAEVDGREDRDRGDARSGQAPDEVADEGGGDDDRPRRDESHRHRVEELPVRQPVVLHDHALPEERHDGEATAEDERAGLEEEQPERKERRGRGGTHGHAEVRWPRREEYQVAPPRETLQESWRRVPYDHDQP